MPKMDTYGNQNAPASESGNESCVGLGGLLYCWSTFLLWISTKRPAGPEEEVQKILGKVLSKVRPA